MLHRLLMLCVGACLGLLLTEQALAQRQTLFGTPLFGGGDRIDAAELAVTPLQLSQLEGWWKTLTELQGRAQPLPPELLPPADDAAWQAVSLPEQGHSRTLASNEAPLEMRWYRIRYAPQAAGQTDELDLYMPRLRSLAVAVLVRTDKGWIPVFDNQHGAREQWVRPLMTLFPAYVSEQLRHEGGIEIVLAVPVLKTAAYMVPRVRLGSQAELTPIYRLRWAAQISLPQSLGLMLLVLGLFAFGLWLRQRHETAYLLAAVACALWIVRTLHYYIDLPDGPLAYNWFWWATHASLAWGMLLSYLIALRFLHQRHERFERIVLLFVLASTMATMPLWRLPVNTVLMQHLVNAVVALGGNVYITLVARNKRDRDMRLITAGLWLGLLPGLHDLGLLAGWWGAEHVSVMPFTTLIIVAAFIVAVKYRFDDAQTGAEAANRLLGERLAEQGAKLQAQHEQLSEVERQQALLLERQRLMQDMHDGLGSSLLSAMVAVEQGRMSQEQVVEVLRECVDDLRLVIDSLEPVGHDLVSLLATMRYRLGKRLQSGGLTLEWDVQDLPPLPWLEPPDALHVLRLLQEALSNALKHAQASRVRIATRDLGNKVEIRVEDDGLGFDPATVQQGRGLRSQIKRARRLGGTLQLDTKLGQGTRLSLILPVKRAAAPPQPGVAPQPGLAD
jgi:signal transduction histidine kinase